MFEVGRGWKAQGMACAKTNKKHASTIRVSCLGIWNKTLELEEVFQVNQSQLLEMSYQMIPHLLFSTSCDGKLPTVVLPQEEIGIPLLITGPSFALPCHLYNWKLLQCLTITGQGTQHPFGHCIAKGDKPRSNWTHRTCSKYLHFMHSNLAISQMAVLYKLPVNHDISRGKWEEAKYLA